MTALGGFWSFDGRPGHNRLTSLVLQAQSRYSNSDPVLHSEDRFTFGRGLFSILPQDDPAEGLLSPSGRYVIAADLRLDNREDLLSALSDRSPAARTISDTALLMAAFDRWGLACLDRLAGDFAIAVIDKHEMTLTLARDPLGQRPLHYSCGDRWVAFSTMPGGIAGLECVDSGPNFNKMVDRLAFTPEDSEESFFTNVLRVLPGHYVQVSQSGVRSVEYWQPSRDPIILPRRADYADAARELLDRAVSAQLRGASGPVAAQLSAGLDSTAVTTSAALQRSAGQPPLYAFTAAPARRLVSAGSRFQDEAVLAAQTAAVYPQIEHEVLPLSEESPFRNLDDNARLYGAPIYNLSNELWIRQINQAAVDRGANVLLVGLTGNFSFSWDGGNFLFELLRSGRIATWAKEVYRGSTMTQARLRGLLFSSLAPALPVPAWRFLQRLRVSHPISDLTNHSALDPKLLNVLTARFGASRLSQQPEMDQHVERLRNLRFSDIGMLNKGYVGGWSLDHRDPTGDVRLLEFCFRTPLEIFASGGVSRKLARDVIGDRVPAPLLQKLGKVSQGGGWHIGFSRCREEVNALVERIAAEPAMREILDIGRLRRLVASWPSDGWEDYKTFLDYGIVLARALSFGHFATDGWKAHVSSG